MHIQIDTATIFGGPDMMFSYLSCARRRFRFFLLGMISLAPSPSQGVQLGLIRSLGLICKQKLFAIGKGRVCNLPPFDYSTNIYNLFQLPSQGLPTYLHKSCHIEKVYLQMVPFAVGLWFLEITTDQFRSTHMGLPENRMWMCIHPSLSLLLAYIKLYPIDYSIKPCPKKCLVS